MLQLASDTHLITSHYALPLLIKRPGGLVIEMTDGTADYNRANYRVSMFYDLTKNSVVAWLGTGTRTQASSLHSRRLTLGWLRSEMMLDIFGVKEANWRDACAKQPHFVISELPHYVGRAVALLLQIRT